MLVRIVWNDNYEEREIPEPIPLVLKGFRYRPIRLEYSLKYENEPIPVVDLVFDTELSLSAGMPVYLEKCEKPK